jgi:hypothetical protein
VIDATKLLVSLSNTATDDVANAPGSPVTPGSPNGAGGSGGAPQTSDKSDDKKSDAIASNDNTGAKTNDAPANKMYCN